MLRQQSVLWTYEKLLRVGESREVLWMRVEKQKWRAE
jgi:hypothetical protein